MIGERKKSVGQQGGCRRQIGRGWSPGNDCDPADRGREQQEQGEQSRSAQRGPELHGRVVQLEHVVHAAGELGADTGIGQRHGARAPTRERAGGTQAETRLEHGAALGVALQGDFAPAATKGEFAQAGIGGDREGEEDGGNEGDEQLDAASPGSADQSVPDQQDNRGAQGGHPGATARGKECQQGDQHGHSPGEPAQAPRLPGGASQPGKHEQHGAGGVVGVAEGMIVADRPRSPGGLPAPAYQADHGQNRANQGQSKGQTPGLVGTGRPGEPLVKPEKEGDAAQRRPHPRHTERGKWTEGGGNEGAHGEQQQAGREQTIGGPPRCAQTQERKDGAIQARVSARQPGPGELARGGGVGEGDGQGADGGNGEQTGGPGMGGRGRWRGHSGRAAGGTGTVSLLAGVRRKRGPRYP
jgi:hypothetical protein